MRPGARMLMMYGNRNRNREQNTEYRPEYRYETEPRDYRTIGYRFRDNRGQEHYDNGRYAPENNRTYEVENRWDGPRYEQERRNPIGFTARFDSTGRADAGYHSVQEGSWMTGEMQGNGGAKSNYRPEFSRQMAEEWAARMRNDDGSIGPHWNVEQIKKVMEQRGMSGDPVKLWIAMNMMYSDYCKVAKKLGVNTLDFYADMANAFLDDKDSGAKDKLAAYYEFIVKP